MGRAPLDELMRIRSALEAIIPANALRSVFPEADWEGRVQL
jgi:hypothetical protein